MSAATPSKGAPGTAATTVASVRVEAFYNLDTETDRYQPGHRVTRVFATEEPGGEPAAVCAEIHRLLTNGHAPCDRWPDPRAVAYRRRGNRGLSLGDIIAISGPTGTTYYALTLTHAPVRAPRRTDEPFYATVPLRDEPPAPRRPARIRFTTALRILAYRTVAARYRWIFDPVRSEAAAYRADARTAQERKRRAA